MQHVRCRLDTLDKSAGTNACWTDRIEVSTKAERMDQNICAVNVNPRHRFAKHEHARHAACEAKCLGGLEGTGTGYADRRAKSSRELEFEMNEDNSDCLQIGAA